MEHPRADLHPEGEDRGLLFLARHAAARHLRAAAYPPDQDEYLYILEGRFDFLLNGVEAFGEPGDLIKLPKGIPHGIFNKSEQTIKTLFWVTPTGPLYDLFWALHNLGPEADPAEVVAISAKHSVDFLPPGKSK